MIFAITQVSRVTGFGRWTDDLLEPDFIDFRNDCSSEACLALFPKKRDGEIEQVNEKPRQVFGIQLFSKIFYDFFFFSFFHYSLG